MEFDAAIKIMREYEVSRLERRHVVLSWIRKHPCWPRLGDAERRKVANYPSDLSDMRLLVIVDRLKFLDDHHP